LSKGIRDESGNIEWALPLLFAMGLLLTVSGVYMLATRVVFFVDFGSKIIVCSLRGKEVFSWADLRTFRIEYMGKEWENMDDESASKPALVMKFRNGRDLHLPIVEKEIPKVRRAAQKNGRTLTDTR